MSFRIIRGDITKVKADAVVNRADSSARAGRGISVTLAPSFALHTRYIQVNASEGTDGGREEAGILRECYEKCLALALKHHCKSIAFPFLETDGYGLSKQEILQTALSVFGGFLMKNEMQIYFVVSDGGPVRGAGRLFSDVSAYVEEHYVSRLPKPEAFRCMPAFQSEEDALPLQTAINPASAAGNAQKPSVFRERPLKDGLDAYMKKTSGSFAGYLQQLINKKGMTNAEVYKRANMDKKYFSKLLNGKVNPTKLKLLSLAVALKLNLDEAKDFLLQAGYAFSPYSKSDLIFEYYIKKGEYDIFTIDIALFDYGLPTLE